jgi:hypothetical protein
VLGISFVAFVACCVWCVLVCMHSFFISGLNNLHLFEGKLIVKNVLILFRVQHKSEICVSD